MGQFRYISRIENNRQKSWFVRLNRLKLPGKSFSDNVFGGKVESLTGAIRWRNETLGANFLKVLNINSKIHTNATKRNVTTKILGISIQKKKCMNKYYYSYRAYSSCCPQKHKEFSWIKHGKESALKMAVTQRQIWEKEKTDRLKNILF